MVHVDLRRIHIEKLLLLMTVLSYMYFIPAYGDFQVHPKVAFTAADVAMEYYQGGTIVCDYPTMNYRFASKWKIRATDLLGNHYSPAYYNILDPMEYARWFRDRNIRLWISADPRAYPVWTVVKENFPELLKLENDVSGIKIYTVNQTVLKQILAT